MDYTQHLLVATDLAHTAGTIIRDNLKLNQDIKWKKDHTPVTAIDTQINDLVITELHKHFPNHSILAEEKSDMSHSQEYIWVCDPIDGTHPFMHGIPLSTFTLALVKNGQPVLGVIYDPYMKRMYTAEKGKKTHVNGKVITTTTDTSLSNATVGTCFWKENLSTILPLVNKLENNRIHVFDYGSISYMDALVACGEFSAVVFPGLSVHDSAAAKIIVEEAGGVFTSLTGEVDRYDRPVHGHIAAANQAVYDIIKNALNGND